MARSSAMLQDACEPGVRASHIEPLDVRVRKNRLKFVLFMFAFTLGTALGYAFIALVTWSTIVFFGFRSMMRSAPDWIETGLPGSFGTAALIGFVVGLVLSWVWVAVRLLVSEVRILDALGARVASPGSLVPTKRVLHDASLAAGLKDPPQLYVIESSRTNAFVLGRHPERARIGVTTGLLERIPLEEQRAVFANLLSRVVSRDIVWATAVSAIMGPIWRVNDTLDAMSMASIVDEDNSVSDRAAASGIWGLAVVQGAVAIVTGLLTWWGQEAAWRAAEKADAEGMLLLKDPSSMLDALQHVLERNNHVPSAGDAYSHLFYCWAGFGFAPEDDPEMRRVARLREALGAEGAAFVPRPNIAGWPDGAPTPPYLELRRETDQTRVGSA